MIKYEASGTYFELIDFTLEREVAGKKVQGLYGVNVAKVREVIRMPQINPLASRIAGIVGVFELRGVPIPAVHLSKVLGDDSGAIHDSQKIIVAEFSHKRAGFIVDATHKIRRLAWDKVLPPTADSASYMSGMTLLEDKNFLFILDLERIIVDLEGKDSGSAGIYSLRGAEGVVRDDLQPGSDGHAPHETFHQKLHDKTPIILLVDDSMSIRNTMKSVLLKAGYQVVTADNGASAWSILEEFSTGTSKVPRLDLVLSDVEMPQMNGILLTENIRKHEKLKQLPVILHTSLSGKASQEIGLRAGANCYVVKNEFDNLFENLTKYAPLSSRVHSRSSDSPSDSERDYKKGA